MIMDEFGNLYITGADAKVFNGNFNELLGGFLAPYVYTKDIPKFIELKNEYNAKVKSGEIKSKKDFKPYYRLDYIEIQECYLCFGNGCNECYDSGWRVKK